ncbi:MAG: SCO family protein [Phycisphaeraceae bacterium]
MNENPQSSTRWIVSALVIVAAIAVGWYLGSRVNEDPETPPGAADSTEPTGEVHRDVAGRVVRVDAEEGMFRVDHEEIEGFMAAMVMDIDVVDPAELEGLEPGDEVLFDLARIGNTYKAIRIRRVDDDGSVPAPSDTEAPPADPLGSGDLVPNLNLYDAQGQPFNLHDLEPRHKVVTFFYARCPLETFCPAQSQQLAELQGQLDQSGSELHLLSLTLDAEHDGASVLQGYAERFEADPSRWTLASGDDPEAIRDFAHRAGARILPQSDSYQIDHALVALRLDGNRIVDRVYGLDAIETMIRQIR